MPTVLECFAICEETVAHCLDLGAEHASRQHITTVLDCAESCAQMAAFMARDSQLHAQAARLCAEACDRCAETCERLAGDDALMRRCAETCRRCAQECRAMAGAAA
jgi:hypothetical protein